MPESEPVVVVAPPHSSCLRCQGCCAVGQILVGLLDPGLDDSQQPPGCQRAEHVGDLRLHPAGLLSRQAVGQRRDAARHPHGQAALGARRPAQRKPPVDVDGIGHQSQSGQGRDLESGGQLGLDVLKDHHVAGSQRAGAEGVASFLTGRRRVRQRPVTRDPQPLELRLSQGHHVRLGPVQHVSRVGCRRGVHTSIGI